MTLATVVRVAKFPLRKRHPRRKFRAAGVWLSADFERNGMDRRNRLSHALLAIPAFAAGFSGSWQFSVDLELHGFAGQ